jgi:hypothetical protein
MKGPSGCGIEGFDGWFGIPSPGYTLFWTMPETAQDPKCLMSRWIAEVVDRAEGFLAHCTRYDLDGFLSDLSRYEPALTGRLISMGERMHFVDSYSKRLDSFGAPTHQEGLDVRYVTETGKARGCGTVSEVLSELREECALAHFFGIENNLSDLAMDMGEYQHVRLFSDFAHETRSRDGTIIGFADWYSHGETYKANLIHLADASMLWGITSGNTKMKYLLPIKRPVPSAAGSYEAKAYDISRSRIEISARELVRQARMPENCYR